jgi:hypothetical protein
MLPFWWTGKASERGLWDGSLKNPTGNEVERSWRISWLSGMGARAPSRLKR